jgi:hypothetical protein
MTVKELIGKVDTLRNTIKDYEKTLQDMRSGNTIWKDWEIDIYKDERPSVQLLFKELQNIRKELTTLQQMNVTLTIGASTEITEGNLF